MKKLRKALFISGIIEKTALFFKGMNEACEGLEELENAFKKKDNKKKKR